MPESRFPPIILLTLLIACLCIYGIILQPDLTFAGMDFVNLGYPKVFLARDALAHGHLPLWNWYEWGGVPLLASLLGALMYPPTWLAMLLPLPYGLQLFTFAHLLFGGIGAFAVGQRILYLSRPAAAICGIVYMGNAFFPGRIEQFQVVAVNSLLPWLVLAIASVLNRRSRGVCLAVCWCATLLAGHPQFALFNIAGALFFTGAPFLYLTFKKQDPWAAKARAVVFAGVVMAGAIGLGTATAAFQLLPTWELGALSERIWPYADPTKPQLEWGHLPSMVIPQFYNMLTGQHGRVFGFTELGLYAGILALPLAVTGAVAGLRTNRPVTAVAIGLWVLAILFALGSNGKLAPFVFENIPFFTQSRGAARSLNVAALMLALLTGRGAMAVIHLAATAPKAKRVVAAVALGALFVGDIALNNYSAMQSILVPTRALGVKPLLPVAQEQALKKGSQRLYRFMATDSDLYLNNSTAAVAERVLRLQPNLNSLNRIALVDGYEEGLMPPRNRANLLRGYNRNLRSDSPDAALLAFMGSNLMLTEYPLPPGGAWAPVAPPYVRPAVVPGISGPAGVYNFSRSAYEPSLLLDPGNLVPAGSSVDAFLDKCAAAFPVQSMARTAASTGWTSHPLEQVTPESYRAGESGFSDVSGFRTWNSLSATSTSGTSQVLVLIPPYPGWKAMSENYGNLLLKPLCSLFYLLQLPDKDGVVSPVNLIFSPFSAKFGLFISLLSGSVVFSLLCNCLRHRILAKKMKMDNT